MKKKKRIRKLLLLVFIILVGYLMYVFNVIEHRSYSSEHFGLEVIRSHVDYDGDGIDDYQDILQGAKQTVLDRPKYQSNYYEGGYPPESEGVCTDVIWRSLENAGYNLKDLMDTDIAHNVAFYPRVEGKPDPNIDFRRVPNQLVYLERKAESLTTDLNQIQEWMPGDIVVFSDSHIGIISDKRNAEGIPFIIHSGGGLQIRREEDTLKVLSLLRGITGHFRFNLNNSQ